MNKILRRVFNWKSLTGMILGGIGGYIYYIEVGCKSGSCPITSNPYLTLAWGLIIGWLLGDTFYKDPSKQKENKQQNT
ncbi:MAG: hypothetical protein C0592_08315 [Marinilabiliales bacterium]|nr:MAG: hypothetical protein C0592_08315 [Marinilabiliales bacterium]